MTTRRMTTQRLKILEYLRSVKTHPNAEMVYLAVKKDMPTITLATVYRNLNLLAEEKEILRLEVNNEFRFDADIGQHQHCVCDRCGAILDIFSEKISRYALNAFESAQFDVDCVNIIFSGICKACKTGGKEK